MTLKFFFLNFYNLSTDKKFLNFKQDLIIKNKITFIFKASPQMAILYKYI